MSIYGKVYMGIYIVYYFGYLSVGLFVSPSVFWFLTVLLLAGMPAAFGLMWHDIRRTHKLKKLEEQSKRDRVVRFGRILRGEE